MIFGYLSLVVSTGFVLFTAASAQVSFDADNRSSWIRVAMLVQQVLFFGWIAALMSYVYDVDAATYISMTIVHYWLFMGAMMSAVPAIMSRRVKRALPKTIVSRSFMSLFMPGPGRGYLFAIANMLGWNLLLVLVMILGRFLLPDVDSGFSNNSDRTLSSREIEEMLMTVTTNCIYGITFLSFLFLILHASVRNRPNAGPLYGAVVAFLLLIVASFVPVLVKLQWFPNSSGSYSLLYTTNWYLTITEMSRYSSGLGGPAIAVFFVAIGMVLFGYLSLRIAGRELNYLPESVPNRVLEEERKKRKTREIPVGESIEEIFAMPREEYP
jgi:hypothetical protein